MFTPVDNSLCASMAFTSLACGNEHSVWRCEGDAALLSRGGRRIERDEGAHAEALRRSTLSQKGARGAAGDDAARANEEL